MACHLAKVSFGSRFPLLDYGVVWEFMSAKQLIQKAEKDYFSDDSIEQSTNFWYKQDFEVVGKTV
ncbi:hypothetical protein HQN90_27170 [Paenibacillus alba]|nr:hypothetical protein [Paenibacillus alba]